MTIFKTSLFTLIVSVAIALCSCEQIEDIKKDQPDTPVDSSETIVGKVTEIGTPAGSAESKTIGVAGGSFSSSDNRIKVEVPEGAFTSDQTLSIQPITNTNGPGKGIAYRISPHDITFAKPVKITFNYTEEEISTSFPEALAIAYQDENQVWQAIGVSELDTVNRSVTILTDHFSDWSLFTSLDLVPPTSTVNPGETIELELVGYFEDDMLVPMVAGQKAPIMEKRDVSQYVKQWTLAGEGVLKANGVKATYSAPSTVPALNPVAVTLELDLKQKGKFFLVRNLFIGRPGVYIKFDNRDYLHLDGEARYLAEGDLTVLTGGTTSEGRNYGLSIIWGGKISMQTFHWTSKLPDFNFNWDARYMYKHHYNLDISPGKLIITGYGEVDGYVTGTFLLEAAGLLDTQAPPGTPPFIKQGKIEGYFRVKRKI